jgi:hypothetical protein
MGLLDFLTNSRQLGVIMKSQNDLKDAIQELSVKIEVLGATVQNEAIEAKAQFDTLYAKILQLQSAPQQPVDFSAEVEALQMSIARLSDIGANAAAIVEEDKAVVEEEAMEEAE